LKAAPKRNIELRSISPFRQHGFYRLSGQHAVGFRRFWVMVDGLPQLRAWAVALARRINNPTGQLRTAFRLHIVGVRRSRMGRYGHRRWELRDQYLGRDRDRQGILDRCGQFPSRVWRNPAAPQSIGVVHGRHLRLRTRDGSVPFWEFFGRMFARFSNIFWCFPRCFDFGRGAFLGVRLLSPDGCNRPRISSICRESVGLLDKRSWS
jgi:hypothetical protein